LSEVARPRAFPREARLTSAADYRRVFEQASRQSDRWFTLLYRTNGRGGARLGLAIAKKQIQRATARNRVKRLVRESFRSRQGQLPAIDIVAMARNPVQRASNRQIQAALAELWQRLERHPS
jgi:ribonuclease P protein component